MTIRGAVVADREAGAPGQFQGIVRQRFHDIDYRHIVHRDISPFGDAGEFLYVPGIVCLGDEHIFASPDPGSLPS